MTLVETVALFVVVQAGVYLLALGVISLVRPALASRFLLGFAGSAGAHYTELSLRLLVGGALVVQAPQMAFSAGFDLFGWVLLATSASLLLMPWRWHQRFAQRVVPRATRYIALLGLVSAALGGGLLAAVLVGSAS